MIYFMQPVDGGPVKIGCSADVERRHAELEGSYGRPLAILATMPGERPEETKLHARFAHLRFGRTEQFRPAPDLMAFIGRPLLVASNPDTIEAIEPVRVTVINLKGTAEFRAWLDAFSEETHIPAASLVRLGLGALAKEYKRPAPPKM